MKKTVSIKKNRDFKLLYRKGKSAVTPVLAMYARKTKHTTSRIGITVSTKVGKAVVRNRVRRRIREAYRKNEELFITGIDLVVVARHRASESSFSEIEKNLLRLAESLGMLSEGQE